MNLEKGEVGWIEWCRTSCMAKLSGWELGDGPTTEAYNVGSLVNTGG